MNINLFFRPAPLIRFSKETAIAWKKAGLGLWENNGIDWLGNAYLLHAQYDKETIEEQLEANSIPWRDSAEYKDGYITSCFGFQEGKKCRGIEKENLDLCIRLMEQLHIKWCGWPEPPIFELLASEQQITQLIEQLQEPIRAWFEAQEA